MINGSRKTFTVWKLPSIGSASVLSKTQTKLTVSPYRYRLMSVTHNLFHRFTYINNGLAKLWSNHGLQCI